MKRVVSRWPLAVLTMAAFWSWSQIASAQPPVKPRLDVHGFPLPEGAFARIGNLHYAQAHEIQGVAISPDGKWVATMGDWLQSMDWFDPYARAVTVFDGATGRSKHRFSSARVITGIRFSPSSNLLAIRHDDGATILDLATGTRESWPPLDARDGESTHQTHVGFVNDEQSVVTCGGVPGGRSEPRIRVWDRKTGKLQREWTSDDGKVAALKLAAGDEKGSQRLRACLSPSGQWMAWQVVKSRTVLKNGQTKTVYDIHVFNTWTGERKGVIRDVDGIISGFGLLDEGETVHFTQRHETEFAGRDGNFVHKSSHVFQAMDVRTGRECYRIHGRVYIAALTGDGKTFWTYTPDRDRGVLRRELATGKPLSEVRTCYRYDRGGFAAAPDGKRTVVADHARWQWADINLKPLQPLTELKATRTDAVWESNRLIRVHGPDNTRKIWDLVDGKFVETIKMDKGPVTWSADVICPQRKLAVFRQNNKVMIADLQRATNPIPLQPMPFEPGRLELSVDSRRILMSRKDERFDEHDEGLAWFDRAMSWYDSKTGRALGHHRVSGNDLLPHEHYGTPKWFADDGSEFAYSTRDHQLAVVDCATGKIRLTIGQRRPYKGLIYGDPAWRYEVEPGRQFVGGLGRRSPAPAPPGMPDAVPTEHAVYDRATGAVLRRFVVPNRTWNRAYSHDHRLFLCRTNLDGDLTVFETATARPRGVIRTGAGASPRLKVSPDGKTLAVGCADTTTLLFDLDRPFSDRPIPPAPKNAKEAAALWDKLGHADPREAEPAIWALARAPALALEAAKERLARATQFPDARQLKVWIDQLSNANFKTRDEASQNLRRVGEPALQALREALPKTDNLEHRRRIEVLIAPLEQPVQADEPGAIMPCLLGLRALEVLERIGTPEARRLVESVVGGANNGVLAHEARLILARWPKAR